MSFATLEARANAAVLRRLSNARGTFGGADFPIIFDRAYVELADGIGATRPVASVASDLLAACVPHTTQITIGGKAYLVRDMQPDGTGMTLLILEAA